MPCSHWVSCGWGQAGVTQTRTILKVRKSLIGIQSRTLEILWFQECTAYPDRACPGDWYVTTDTDLDLQYLNSVTCLICSIRLPDPPKASFHPSPHRLPYPVEPMCLHCMEEAHSRGPWKMGLSRWILLSITCFSAVKARRPPSTNKKDRSRSPNPQNSRNRDKRLWKYKNFRPEFLVGGMDNAQSRI